MTTQTHLIIIGEQLKRAREASKLSQHQLSDLYKQQREQLAATFPHARKSLPNFDISRLENSQPNESISKQKRQTIELLAEILRTAPLTLAQPEVPTLPLAPEKEWTDGEAKDLGLALDLPSVELPFTPVAARASFVEMCGSQADYGAEETIRYILPPRPVSEYVKNKSRCFEVNGDSMSPEIHSGERIIADPVPEARWELLSNQIIVISYAETLTIKWVRENELLTRRVLTLHPNRPELAPLTVRRELIHCIYLVRESFERKKWG